MDKLAGVSVRVVNLTPHVVRLFRRDGSRGYSYLPSVSGPARVAAEYFGPDHVGPLTVGERFGEIEGLPEQQDGVRFIVSRVVWEAAGRRGDLLVPNTGNDPEYGAVRDADGQIVGVRSFIERRP